jgi:3-methylcrotonyl-CoA carboxylase alpha subunit
MFRRILIANRGEIACRVIETCRRLGVSTVAVHSDADAGARHVAMADLAVSLGGQTPAESYLRQDAILAAARATGAEAIHPGYGFLSENPDFVAAVEAAGLTFIGPSAQAIRAMGLKDAAKALMQAAGVPVVPGYHGENQDPDHLSGAADTIGYPVLIKAVAGGGGKGMRLVTRPQDFAAALRSARGEAEAAFGNPAVLIEKFVSSPRHIEVQVFGDGTRAVHLFERDCSLQRRHQKVIEEAPAPGMTDEMRAAMGQAATRAAEAIGYAGAGTVEFIVDGSDGLRPDRFWFMEMNTRLQVEHPVTEAVTGIDLVEWQLRVASGEPLPARQEDLRLTGHAVEARLYAEDPANDFLPVTGTLAHLAFPPGVRADTGVRSGDRISPFYDPMIAKIIAHGPSRSAALQALETALTDTQVAGTVTNRAFLARLLAHADVRAGRLDTGLIAREIDALTAVADPDPATLAAAALAALGLTGAPDPLAGVTLWTPLTRRVTLSAGETARDVAVTTTRPGTRSIAAGGATLTATHLAGGWRLDGQPLPATWTDGTAVEVFGPGAARFTVADPLDRARSTAGDPSRIAAPMPGLVKALFVTAGERVAPGAPLAVLEAMKMEHTLTAAVAGTVAELLVTEGAQVEAGAALVRLEPEDAA